MIEMALSRIVMRENNEQVVIFLKEADGERVFPIIIGLHEAFEIKRKVLHVETARPLTHDLVRNILRELDATLDYILIDTLKDATFYAKLQVCRNGDVKRIDARSSDAIALAVAEGVPIYVEEAVMDEVCKADTPDDFQPDDPPADDLSDPPEDPTIEDLF